MQIFLAFLFGFSKLKLNYCNSVKFEKSDKLDAKNVKFEIDLFSCVEVTTFFQKCPVCSITFILNTVKKIYCRIYGYKLYLQTIASLVNCLVK